MTKVRKAVAALGLLVALALGVAQTARAVTYTNPANLDLLVSFTAALSVTVDGVQYSTRTLTGSGDPTGFGAAGQTIVPVSSSTVLNNSAGLTEKFLLSAADVSTTPVTLWTIVTTTGPSGSQGGTFCSLPGNIGAAGCPQPDQVALQALFISSANTAGCPSNVTADWDTFMSTVGASGVLYTSSIYADTSAGFGNQNGGTGNPDQTAGLLNGNVFSNTGAVDGRGRRGLCVRLEMPSSSTSVEQHIVRLTITATAGS